MEENTMFGGEGLFIFALLILLFGFGGNGFGFNKGQGDVATKDSVYYTSAFNQLQSENQNLAAEIQRVGYDNMTTVKDVAYNNLSEIRDLESAVAVGFANQQKCCCETLRAIDSVNYNIATTSAANTQKILDAITTNRMAEMQNEINKLQLQAATCGMPRYTANYTIPYSPTPYPYFTGTTVA